MLSIDDLTSRLKTYLLPADVDLVRKAYDFAKLAHAEQQRASGEEYVTHPLAAAMTLAEMGLDAQTIAAALLHDVPEDTKVPMEKVEAEFGPEVAHLVDGVTKLSKIEWGTLEERQAESLRKMFLAMAEDMRVVLIKLADRLHNMSTLDYLRPDKRLKIARETLEIYAPLASRLGIWNVKWQLEDLAFRHLNPQKYREIARLLANQRQGRERYLDDAMAVLKEALAKAGIEAELYGRAKHIYSIFRKMERKHSGFDQIYDLLAVRVIVKELAECYGALGVVHSLWHPIPGEFDDYIAVPKENLYRSLHTAVVGPQGQPLEVQIRTSRHAPRGRVRRGGPLAVQGRHVAPRRQFRVQGGLAAPAHGVAQGDRRRQGVRGLLPHRYLPGPGLRLHPQERHHRPAGRVHAGRLRLPHSHRYRLPLPRRPRQRATGGSGLPSAERGPGGESPW